MGHYDDVREARQDREDEKRASRLGLTVNEMIEADRLKAKVTQGYELYLKRRKEEVLVQLYLNNKELIVT